MKEKIATRQKTFEIIKKYSLNEKKRYGQNFIINPEIIESIVSKSFIEPDVGVIEIGPGVGALTQELINKSGKLIAIEIDNSLIPILNDNFNGESNFKLINNDFLKVDLDKLINEEFKDFKTVYIISNLPYYITSQIIEKILDCKNEKITKLILMMQKEVALKLTKKDSRLTSYLKLLLDLKTKANILLHISKNVFFPRPKVDSIVLDININKEKINNEEIILKFAKQAFMNKRKTLINNLRVDNINKEKLSDLLKKNNFKENIRVEELKIADFIKISEIISNN